MSKVPTAMWLKIHKLGHSDLFQPDIFQQIPIQALRSVLLLCLTFAVTAPIHQSWADEDHSGHSDDLLLLIQYKLSLKKLQAQAAKEQNVTILVDNFKQQEKTLSKAMHKLQHYVAISSGHYPNDALYQQSLENRAAMLKDFALLMSVYHQQARAHHSSEYPNKSGELP